MRALLLFRDLRFRIGAGLSLFAVLISLNFAVVPALAARNFEVPEVTLVDPGDETNRISPRYQGRAFSTDDPGGRIQIVTVKTTSIIGGESAPEKPQPTIRLQSVHRIESDEDSLRRSIVVRDVDVLRTDGVDRSETRAARVAATAIDGARCRPRLDARGRPLEPSIWAFAGSVSGPPRRLLDDAVLGLGRVPLPEDAIGVGASWKSPVTIRVGGRSNEIMTTWTRVAEPNETLRSDRYLRVQIERTWESTETTNPPVERRIAYSARGEFTLDLQHASVVDGRYLEDVVTTPNEGPRVRTSRSATYELRGGGSSPEDAPSPKKGERR